MRRLLNYWLFTNAGSTSVPLSSSVQLVALSTSVPITRSQFARLVAAYASISPSDTGQKLFIDTLAILVTISDSAGVAITSLPLPLHTPTLPLALPAVTSSSIRVAAVRTPDSIDVIPQRQLLPGSRTPASVAIQALAVVRNSDGAGAHSASLAVGGIIGVAEIGADS